MSTAMSPGWYPDPADPNPSAPATERWWTGTEWHPATRPTQTGQPPRTSYNRAVAILTVLAVLVCIAVIVLR